LHRWFLSSPQRICVSSVLIRGEKFIGLAGFEPTTS
jgi:hypothetical protein